MHRALAGRLQTISSFSALKSSTVAGPKFRLLLLHTKMSTTATPTHTPDTYLKEVDTTPVDKSETVNRIDPETDAVQRPDEPPSGPWSRAGAMTEEYRHVESGEPGKQPYAPTGGSKGRYGSKGDWAEEKGPETSGPDEGPDARSSHGRV